MKTTLEFVSPSGVTVTLEVTPDDEQATIVAALERAEKIAGYFLKHGWTAGQGAAAQPAQHSGQGPTFAGYPCSPTTDDRGLPTWIMVDGKQAQRREKQGDVWYSAKMPDGTYAQVLRIPKGEQAPGIVGQ